MGSTNSSPEDNEFEKPVLPNYGKVNHQQINVRNADHKHTQNNYEPGTSNRDKSKKFGRNIGNYPYLCNDDSGSTQINFKKGFELHVGQNERHCESATNGNYVPNWESQSREYHLGRKQHLRYLDSSNICETFTHDSSSFNRYSRKMDHNVRPFLENNASFGSNYSGTSNESRSDNSSLYYNNTIVYNEFCSSSDSGNSTSYNIRGTKMNYGDDCLGKNGAIPDSFTNMDFSDNLRKSKHFYNEHEEGTFKNISPACTEPNSSRNGKDYRKIGRYVDDYKAIYNDFSINQPHDSDNTKRGRNVEILDNKVSNENQNSDVRRRESNGIPFNFPNTYDNVNRKRGAVQNLRNISCEANTVVRENGVNHLLTYSSQWSVQSKSPEDIGGLSFIEVSSTTEEAAWVNDRFNHSSKGKDFVLKIKGITRIENPHANSMYLLKKEELQSRNGNVDELFLFHGTKEDNLISICSDNFDWRRFSENHRFGQGVSFSPSSSYSSHYSDKSFLKIMFLVKVLVSNAVVGSSDMKIPLENGGVFDASIKDDTNVIVKYSDNEFYPVYIITYTKQT